MRNSIVVLASTVLLLAASAAWAATIQCSNEESKCVGTSRSDTIYGADTNHDFGYGYYIRGREGDDKIYGRGGDDRERDTGDDDNDVVRGGDGQDNVFGGPGTDSLTGETSNYVGPAPDFISGGPGDDFIRAEDTTRDRNYCGLGHDTVFADNAQSQRPQGLRGRLV